MAVENSSLSRYNNAAVSSRETTAASTTSSNNEDSSNRATPSSKPSLSLNFQPPSSVSSSSSYSPNLSVGNGSPQVSWQLPYSELSRFPSSSYRFKHGRDKDWPLEGAQQYMTPLPSPSVHNRDRSISDAASETSFVSDVAGSNAGSDKAGTPTATNTNNSSSRSKTMEFFESAGASIMSPPPPPRMPSSGYDHTKKEDWTPSITASSTFGSSIPSPPESSTSSSRSHHSSFDGQQYGRSSKNNMLPSPSSIESGTSSILPLSQYPSGFRSSDGASVQRSNPASSSGNATHRRIGSGSSASFMPSGLGKTSTILESPLTSPTETVHSRWLKDPPSRLPTLLPEQQRPSQSVSTPSTASSISTSSSSALRSANLPMESLSVADDTPPRTSRSTADTSSATPMSECEPGNVLKGRFEIVKHLGLGSFSRVVLARRLTGSSSDSDDAAATTRRHHSRMPSGPYPTSIAAAASRGQARSNPRNNSTTSFYDTQASDELVAIKLISRSHIKKNDRMRISIVREVEVLKHIRHPSLVHLTSSFDTPWHTCLVLEYAAGGELFDFIAKSHRQMSEALARRIFGELADVLGWMHSIGLVHRDIKLENILLTCNPLPSSTALSGWPDPSSLPPIPTPLVKLTDFGLSRFVDLSSPYLETRCGSEEYAAPELIMGKRYDGRQTDAWALGVVLYALLVGQLPFVEDGSVGQHDTPSRSQVSPASKGSMRSRKTYLLKIAKAEYQWPAAQTGPNGEAIISDETRLVNDRSKALVKGLLSRDPKKRLRMEEIWDLEWMSGPGMPEKRFVHGGNLEGVALTAFEREDEAMVRAEVPDPG